MNCTYPYCMKLWGGCHTGCATMMPHLPTATVCGSKRNPLHTILRLRHRFALKMEPSRPCGAFSRNLQGKGKRATYPLGIRDSGCVPPHSVPQGHIPDVRRSLFIERAAMPVCAFIRECTADQTYGQD